ncbi:DEAD-domain-containing protein [Punctularia strigosozonata HHB-11173 SS5]|uniref:DEAD-domain-containing protein n=1 Tax=Punctularia strigosozonata (strain HHB-11173) TaxID=741275 RepID=UPI0004416479|nr:DEAD-domain-containing protein [Punctularia strigosozonata HHB-11173 SS5]EIN11681.1 DEAD-domain-containing protein [Punctularia strigosozonata HHB-11173 SS5]
MQASLKRHRLSNVKGKGDDWESEERRYDSGTSEDEVDISNVLAGKKKRKLSAPSSKNMAEQDEDDDEALADFIKASVSKRNVKLGTEVVKRTKGKTKIAKGEVGGGSFQSMGLHPWILRSLSLQGFRIPTPIQRLSIPSLLSNPPRDLVGMARTGSGKSLAYMIPLIQRLDGMHSSTFGARALILLPTRELALQILRVGKELARGRFAGGGEHAGDTAGDAEQSKKGQGLRWALVVGGEGLDEQFEMMTNNPDVIIATPGRLLHLIVEMNLDLRSVEYVVFDEADRLFEMGFETAMTEILHRLPASRQTLLFSATLPKSLVEFAKAGLQDPKLVRLDAESKISSDLKMAFFSVKQAEKDACLLTLLRDVIQVPLGSSSNSAHEEPTDKKGKGKAKAKSHEIQTAPHQTLVFVATKHHVEYLTTLLATAGYAVSHIYGSLDQTARTIQMDQFRRGQTSILVVTDVAARGIDIPVLENVINYDFPQGARVFVHRVGRTARAGRPGWAWSFVTNTELPYLLDLQLFLGRPLKSEVDDAGVGDSVYAENLVLGTFHRDKIDQEVESIRGLDEINHSLYTLREVMRKGQSMYERSKGKASPASYKRAKAMTKDIPGKWGLAGSAEAGVHPVLLRGRSEAQMEARHTEDAKKALLKAVNSFRPAETVFEIGKKGQGSGETAALMKQRRKALEKAKQRAALTSTSQALVEGQDEGEQEDAGENATSIEMADEEDIEAVFGTEHKNRGKGSYRDSEYYLSYVQKGNAAEKGYSLTDGASFAEQARNATFDLTGDEGLKSQKRQQLRWDQKKKKFVKGDGAGADNVKMVKTESGTKLPATYRSGRFDEWKAKTRNNLPRVGEMEQEGSRARRSGGPGGRKFKHNKVTEAKPLDKLSKDYERKVKQVKRAEKGEEQAGPSPKGKGRAPGKVQGKGRNAGKSMSRVRSELKSAEQIRKARKVHEQKKAKNARRPAKRKGRH